MGLAGITPKERLMAAA